MKKTSFSASSKYILALFLFTALSQAIFAVGTPPRGTFLDFSGDMRTDFVTLRPSSGPGSAWLWNILRNQDSQPDVSTSFIYGGANDQITAANYYNANKAEISLYRSSQATFFESPYTDYMTSVQYPTLTGWGQAGDNARFFGDYDGDKFEDRTLLRYQPSTGLFYWYIKGSKGTNYTFLFGSNNPDTYEFAFRGADYNGDGRDEIVFVYVYIATGQVVWYFGDPINQTLVGVHSFGNYNTDKLLNPADYTGDKKADLIVWQCKGAYYPGMGRWQLFDRAINYTYSLIDYGWTDYDVPVQGDYDGDGIYDIAWYRPSISRFSWTPSSMRPRPPGDYYHLHGPISQRAFGTPGDTPVAGLWVY